MASRATAIPLRAWQDPQADLVLYFSEGGCRVEFSCWTDSAEPASYRGILRFERARAARSELSEFVAYTVKPHDHRSYILEVHESEWIDEFVARNRALYGERSTIHAPAVRHFVVVGHDIFHEVIASSFVEEQT